MDGSIAAVFLLASLGDMAFTDCRTDGCLALGSDQARLSLSVGEVAFQSMVVEHEAYLRYDFARHYGPFQPSVGASVTTSGDVWVGLGAVYNIPLQNDRIYGQLSLLPGIYQRGSGPDLGHEVEFRSGIEFGYQADSGMRIGLSFDHRSNLDFGKINPGLETLQLRVSFPMK